MNAKAQAGAIQEDVQAEEQTPMTMESPNSPRNIAMEAINESRLRQLQEESGVDLSAAPANDTQIEEQLADPEPEPTQPAPIKVKVDGSELEVTQEELVRTYQKNAAADRRLEEAARILKHAEELTQQRAAEPAAAPNHRHYAGRTEIPGRRRLEQALRRRPGCSNGSTRAVDHEGKGR